MALTITTFNNPYSTTPLNNAYVWITFQAIDFFDGTGRIQVAVNSDEASANAGLPPIFSFSVALGEILIPATENVAAIMFPDLPTLVANAATAATTLSLSPFDAIRKALYDALLNHPKLSGATEIA
jgi:hypothetical protein